LRSSIQNNSNPILPFSLKSKSKEKKRRGKKRSENKGKRKEEEGKKKKMDSNKDESRAKKGNEMSTSKIERDSFLFHVSMHILQGTSSN